MILFIINNLQGDYTMEIVIIVAVVVVIGALIYFNRSSKGLDVNNDGVVDAADAKAAVQNVVEGVKATADVNKDGVVDSADAKVAVETVKKQVKRTANKAKTAAAKPKTGNRGRKPKAK
jgi:hypothetical protein